VSGSFSRDDSGTNYDVSGSASFAPGGLSIANANFHVSNSGVSGSGRLAIPSFAAADVAFTIPANGAVHITASVGFIEPMRTILGNPTATVVFHDGPDTLCSWFNVERGHPPGTPLQTRYVPFPNFHQEGLYCYEISQHYIAFSASVKDVLKIPGSFSLTGRVDNRGNYDVSLGVTLGPYGGSTDFFLCTAWYSAGGTFNVRITGAPTSLTIGVSLAASVTAGCGKISATIGGGIDFTYTTPATFHLKVYLSLSLGVYTWNPTVYNA
jgi:hypothetical protein